MTVKRGHVAPQNTYIDTIIRKFDSQSNINLIFSIHAYFLCFIMFYLISDRKFLIANAQVANKPIIYCNDAFCNLIKYTRPEVMQKPCTCEFLYGMMTSSISKVQVAQALSRTEETQIAILLYRRDGNLYYLKSSSILEKTQTNLPIQEPHFCVTC